MTPSKRIEELGIVLPPAPAPVGSYRPALRSGPWVLTSGQLPMRDGALTCTGKVPSPVGVEEAARGARQAMLNALAVAAAEAGGIDAIERVVRVCVFVNSTPDFTDQPKVANGASDLLLEIFGEAGRHVRAAVGAAALPLDAPVEVELIVQVRT
ncbi:MAG: RidA family protein [Planctomycetota bacterium]|nr:MAG: RidA family protein [Planctomycetota bacterium]